MNVTGQFHVPAIRSQGNEPKYVLDRKAGWAPEPISTLLRKEKTASIRTRNPQSSGPQASLRPQVLARLRHVQATVSAVCEACTTILLRINIGYVGMWWPCCWIRLYRRFERMYCLYRQGLRGPKTQRHGITPEKTRLLHKAPLFVQERETRLGEPQPEDDELTFSARLLCAEPLIPSTVGSDEREP